MSKYGTNDSVDKCRGLEGAKSTAGLGEYGGGRALVGGAAWDGGSGMENDTLGGSGRREDGEEVVAGEAAASSAWYRADAGVKAEVASNMPTGLGVWRPLVRKGGEGGRAGNVWHPSLQEDDGGRGGPRMLPRLLNLMEELRIVHWEDGTL